MTWRARRQPGILRRAAALFRAHDLLMMGAGIAFFFTLALIPLLLLSTSALGFALGSPQQATVHIVTAVRRIAPGVTTAQIEAVLRSLVEGRAVAGWLGLLSFLWVGSGAFEAIANAMTTLSGLGETRSFLHRKLVALALMLACGVLFFASLTLASLATAVRGFGNLILEILPIPPGGMRLPPGTILGSLSLLLVGATFLILYRWTPPQPMPWGPAIAGAIAGAGLWYLAKRAFEWYVLTVATQQLIYGLLGSFIGLLLWVYYTSIIFLVGAVLSLACWRTRPTPSTR
jgi:membrane protein